MISITGQQWKTTRSISFFVATSTESLPVSYSRFPLKEYHRLLKPGGIVRIVIPHFEKLIERWTALLKDYSENRGNAEEEATFHIFDYLIDNILNVDMLRYWQHHPKFSGEFGIGSKIIEVVTKSKDFEIKPKAVTAQNKSAVRRDPKILIS